MKLPINGKINVEEIQYSNSEIQEAEFYTKLEIMLEYLPIISKNIQDSIINMINEIVIDYKETKKLRTPVIGTFMKIVLASSSSNSEYKKYKAELLDFEYEQGEEINILRAIFVKSINLQERLNQLIENGIIDKKEYIQKENKINQKYLEQIKKINKKERKR